MARLSIPAVPAGRLIVPVDRRPVTGIVHLGLGNFHRAHLAVYTAQAVRETGGDWGIFAYSSYDSALAQGMREQDLLYSVVELSPTGSAAYVPGIHTGAVGSDGDVNLVLDEIAKVGTKIVSLTVTEAGYDVDPTTRQLNLTLPKVSADLAGGPPRSTIGILVRGLQRRMNAGSGAITVLSCDNMFANGDLTKRLTHQFIDALPAVEAEALRAWVTDQVTFPNSMVDRIVPGVGQLQRDLAAERLGILDAVPVGCEPFRMWVLEDDFAAGRPAWETQGVIFSDNVAGYETLKLRLLNGTHSLLAYLGALAGCRTIPQARFQPDIEWACRHLIHHELAPTFDLPAGVDLDEYVDELFVRWSNTVLADRIHRVGQDGSTKLPQRVANPLSFHAARGKLPEVICLMVAGYLACICPSVPIRPGAEADLMLDPSREAFADLMSRAPDLTEGTRAVLGAVFDPHVAGLTGFAERVAELLSMITSDGVHATIARVRETVTM